VAKPFDQGLYAADNPAVGDAIIWLHRQGWEARVNPDTYGIDVLAEAPNGQHWEIEVEVKHNWVGQRFPYSTVHFSARKIKFAYHNSLFIMFNHDRSAALAVRGSIVAKSPQVTKKTIYTDFESFIEVPFRHCQLLAL
jgi:hypothetical protein